MIVDMENPEDIARVRKYQSKSVRVEAAFTTLQATIYKGENGNGTMLNQIQPKRVKDFIAFWQDKFLIDNIQRPEHQKHHQSGGKTYAKVEYMGQTFNWICC